MNIKEKVLREMSIDYAPQEYVDDAIRLLISLTLQEVEKIIKDAYNKCRKCLDDAINNNRGNLIENFKGRIDELILLYSDIKEINFNEAKQKLKEK